MNDFDEDDMEVAAQIEELNREIEGLKLENEVFKSHYDRSVGDGNLSGAQADVLAEEMRTAGGGKPNAAGGKGTRGRRHLPQKLTMEQKCEIANAELEQLQRENDETKKSSEKLIDTLRAVLEETDIRIAELKKDAYEFKRDIVVGAENMRTGKTIAEKMVRYMEEKLRGRDSVIEKLRLKNATIKSHIQKVEAQLKQKEEMGDVLHYIDFHQLQIENKQYISRIEERNEELLRLKMTTGKTVQTLNSLKQRLHALLSESESLQKEIAARTEQLRKVREDNAAVGGDISTEQRARKRLGQQQAETSDMPQVLDYVAQKAEMYDLHDNLRNWERKVEIMEMAAKRARKLAMTGAM